MGGGLSHAQQEHVDELWQLAKGSYFSLSSGRQESSITKRKIKDLLEEVWKQCPWYPEQGSLKVHHWTKIGKTLHKEPRAGAKELKTWRAISAILEEHQQSLLLKPFKEPPPYPHPPIILPPTDKKEVSAPVAEILEKTNENKKQREGLIQKTMREGFQTGALTAEEITEMHLFPVTIQNAGQVNQEVNWQPLPLGVIREVKMAVKEYGLRSPYTLGFLNSVGFGNKMILQDWKDLMRMLLTGTQNVVWQSEFQREALVRGQASGGRYTPDQIFGAGQFATLPAQCVGTPEEAYPVITAAVMTALNRVDEVGKPQKSFSQIKQGPQEPYSEFVDRLQQAISKQISNGDAAEELMMKLAVENTNVDCRKILEPLVARPGTSLVDMLKTCIIVGSTVYSMDALVAALQKGNKPQGNCFNCGKPGHFKAQFRDPGGGKCQGSVSQRGTEAQDCMFKMQEGVSLV